MTSVAHDWRSHGLLPSGRTRWTCRRCPARTTRATAPPTAPPTGGDAGRCAPGRWDARMLAAALGDLEGRFRFPRGAALVEVPPDLWDELVSGKLTDGNNDALWGSRLRMGAPGRVTVHYAREVVQTVACRFAAGPDGPVRLGAARTAPGPSIAPPDVPWRMWIGRKASPRAMDVLGWDGCGRPAPPGARWAVVTGWEPCTPGPGDGACLILCADREEAVCLAPLAGGTAVFGMFDASRAT